MMNRIFGDNTHTYIHILGLSGIAFGLPWSKAVMSVGMMLIVLNLLLEADLKSYWNNLKSNRVYWIIVALFLLYPIGMLWSSNLDEAFHSFKQKLPLITIPTILVAKPLKRSIHVNLILLAFMGSLVFTSILNFGYYQQWFGAKSYNDIRGLSLFCSHIRYGLLISMGAAICLFSISRNRKLLLPGLIILAWLGFYTIFSQVISGAITFAAVVGIYLLYHLWLRTKLVATIFSFACLGLTGALTIWLLKPLNYDESKYQNLPEKTAEGNPYEHNFEYISYETGEPVLIYLCEEELEREWEKRSTIGYLGTTVSGNPISHTLIRYLASKGLYRDATGVNALSDADIRNIEQGCTSIHHTGLMARMHSIRFELNHADDPNGNSLLQRFEYWNAALYIMRNHWMIGVGSGDAQLAFDAYYIEHDSQLSSKNRDRAHNQFMTFFLTFGVFGILLFLAFLIAFVQFNVKNKQLLAILFITICIVSFLIEDTLDTQTGVTFFALFVGMFLYVDPRHKNFAAESREDS
jgi:hypothetical protein